MPCARPTREAVLSFTTVPRPRLFWGLLPPLLNKDTKRWMLFEWLSDARFNQRRSAAPLSRNVSDQRGSRASPVTHNDRPGLNSVAEPKKSRRNLNSCSADCRCLLCPDRSLRTPPSGHPPPRNPQSLIVPGSAAISVLVVKSQQRLRHGRASSLALQPTPACPTVTSFSPRRYQQLPVGSVVIGPRYTCRLCAV